MKKLFLCASLIGLATFALPVSATMLISEIMYDVVGTDSGYEWIEIHNTGSVSVDISDWRFTENETDHYLSLESGGGPVVEPNQYAVIASNSANFLTSNPGFSGMLFDSVFSLNNQGEALSIKSPEETTDSVYYTPQDAANGTGGSLQYIDGVWAASIATPGLSNVLQSVTDDTGTGANNTQNSGSGNVVSKKPTNNSVEFEPYYWSALHTEPVILAGDPTKFDFELLYYNREDRDPIIKHSGEYVWNMGDGHEFVQEWEEEMEYVYSYPGTYVVAVSYYKKNQMSEDPKHEFSTTITVKGNEVVIGGIDQEGSIRIDNNTGKQIDISDWIVIYGSEIYVFPTNSILPIGEQRYITKDIHNFKYLYESSPEPVVLVLPSGSIQASVVPHDLLQEATSVTDVSPETKNEAVVNEDSTEIIVESQQNKTPHDAMFWMVLVFGAISVLITIYTTWRLNRKETLVTTRSLKNQVELTPGN